MKIIVLKEFRDIDDFNLVHKVGSVIDVDGARAARLVELGLADGEKVAATEKAEAVKTEKAAAPDLKLEQPEPATTPEPKRRRKE